MNTYSNIEFSIENHIAKITLNRPERLNALSDGLKADFLSAVRFLNQNPGSARALLITGNGRAFCAGADLGDGIVDMKKVDLAESLISDYHPMLLELANLEIPVVSAVNGIAAGAGMSIAISADIVVAARSAYFLQAFVNIGLVPDSGSTYLLPRLIGNARANAMMMLGEKVTAETALNWGMIAEVVDDEDLNERSHIIVSKLAAGPTQALSGIRQLMAGSMKNNYAEQLQMEAVVQRRMGASNDCIEGISAFLQKRPAQFTGK
ncbi:enoyl-CoA hydratase-related protein [Kordiimonas aquimaris]|uniref:enoyl-CoA hydratase-related protein n=1 Tax=Kordiimonas aquimaris TaxID=707591 RepID=UPI0021D275D0|nr:enoyl-CoA hydratase-related protein [Kordiimonas aquimaris]